METEKIHVNYLLRFDRFTVYNYYSTFESRKGRANSVNNTSFTLAKTEKIRSQMHFFADVLRWLDYIW